MRHFSKIHSAPDINDRTPKTRSNGTYVLRRIATATEWIGDKSSSTSSRSQVPGQLAGTTFQILEPDQQLRTVFGSDWSLFQLPFSKHEIRAAFVLNESEFTAKLQRTSNDIGTVHPDDHLKRHVFYSGYDTIQLLYDGPVDTEVAGDILFDLAEEDAAYATPFNSYQTDFLLGFITQEVCSLSDTQVTKKQVLEFLILCRTVVKSLSDVLSIYEVNHPQFAKGSNS